MSDHPNESCGLVAVYDYEGNRILPSLYWGIISQNHRGHQSYGFLTYDGGFRLKTGLGLVPVSEKHSENHFDGMPGSVGLGHVRYATSGERDKLEEDVQPFIDEYNGQKVAIGYNGNIVNTEELKDDIEGKFGGLSSTSDTELLSKKLLEGLDNGDLDSAVELCMEEMEGSYSVVGINSDGVMFAFRDPLGFKPLCYGQKSDGKVHGVASESAGLSINGFKKSGEIKSGELLTWFDGGISRTRIMKKDRAAFCTFEYDYFARPDSTFHGQPVYKVREEFGRNLARENPDVGNKADLIVSIPRTADDSAYGFHLETNLPWERAVRKHRYVTSRAFISSAEERDEIVDKKLNVDWGKIRGKNIAIVEDSIVRGTTSKTVVGKMKEAGVGDIHLFITFPRIISPCFYGIDMTSYQELIGSNKNPEEIADILGVKSVNYQSIENFVKAIGLERDQLCLGCVTDEYPTPRAQEIAKKYTCELEKREEVTGRIYER